LRIRGEYLLSVGVDPVFHATSGDAMPWSRYRDGERARAQGNRLVWSNVGTPASWEHYLQAVFMWAGTASMQTSETVADPHVDPGDVLVQGGFPGHAVLVLDVAIQGDKTWVLIGEGFMPAMDFHVELGPDDGWWPFTEGVALPHWTLPRDTLRTWR
jgi:hypothetical protein